MAWEASQPGLAGDFWDVGGIVLHQDWWEHLGVARVSVGPWPLLCCRHQHGSREEEFSALLLGQNCELEGGKGHLSVLLLFNFFF